MEEKNEMEIIELLPEEVETDSNSKSTLAVIGAVGVLAVGALGTLAITKSKKLKAKINEIRVKKLEKAGYTIEAPAEESNED